jgi:hypothetical protein
MAGDFFLFTTITLTQPNSSAPLVFSVSGQYDQVVISVACFVCYYAATAGLCEALAEAMTENRFPLATVTKA